MKRFLFIMYHVSCIICLCFAYSLLPLPAYAGSCDYPNFCDSTTHTTAPNPGSDCVIQGITTNVSTNTTYAYKYSSSSSCGLFGWFGGPCTVKCGFLSRGDCCEPKDKAHPAPAIPTGPQAPPCGQYSGGGTKGSCLSVNTAIGPLSTDIAGLTQNIFGILLGLSGGLAILLIIAAGYQLMTSQGNPEKVKEARERLTAAIVGLLFIIFSVAILQIIGVTILQIPGFK